MVVIIFKMPFLSNIFSIKKDQEIQEINLKIPLPPGEKTSESL